MAKQTFTTGQVLTAAQMTSLQQTAMGGGSTTAKTTSYTLVAADAGTVVQMNSASATTITVNTALFAAGDTVQIQNIGAGVCTVTAGTATVNTAGSLALSQYEGGQLYFTSASASIFFDLVQSAAAGGKVLQVVQATYSTATTINGGVLADTGLTASITPSLATSKVLVMISQYLKNTSTAAATEVGAQIKLLRGSTGIAGDATNLYFEYLTGASTTFDKRFIWNLHYLDSPATTSATAYKTQAKNYSASVVAQSDATMSTMILLEIGA